MTHNYVRGASISSSAYQEEIQALLTAHGAAGFRCERQEDRAAVTFQSGGRHFRFILALPNPADAPPAPAGGRQGPRTADGRAKTVEDATRRRWRQLSLLIQAKLEAVSAGIVTFDEEFLAYMVMPGGSTVFQAAAPSIGTAYAAAEGNRQRPPTR